MNKSPVARKGGLEALEMGGRFESIQTTALLKLAWILRRVLVNPKLHGHRVLFLTIQFSISHLFAL